MSLSKTLEQPLFTRHRRQQPAPSGLAGLVRDVLAQMDIDIDGDRPWDVQVHNQEFYKRVLWQQSLGLGESYMEGWWDCQALDQFFAKVVSAQREGKVRLPSLLSAFCTLSGYLSESWLKRVFGNPQSKTGAFRNAQHHYDLGNDFYQAMLDKRMVYTCAYWKDAATLDEAQEAKLELVCQKLRLKPGIKILDVGCGWGSLIKYAAERYGVNCVGVTVSKQQYEWARMSCRDLPVEVRLQDYRDVKESFDRVVSLGMFEHVGKKNYRTYMETVHRCLKEGGLFVLQTIAGNRSTLSFDPWLDRYIFPGAGLPSIKQIGRAVEGLLIMEEWMNTGPHYDQTLMAWFANFNRNWPKFSQNYDAKFYRMWKYFLLSCAGLFRGRQQQLWRVVFRR